MVKKLAVAFMMAALSAVAHAGPEATGAKGGTCGGVGIFNGGKANDGAFECEHLGHVTIKEIYERGWRVVSSGFLPEKAASPLRSYMYLIIEEQRK